MNQQTKQVAKIEEAPPPAEFGASLMEVISKAASDPAVDIDKMERLIAMHERIQAQQAEVAFSKAMNAAQAEMRPIAANASNPQTRSRYATFDKLDRVLRPIYTAHGFSLSFDEEDSPKPEHVRVVCHVSHIAGHTRTYRCDMPADGKGAKGGDVMTKTHAAGAAKSYGARYLEKGIFNVAVGEEDDDGNAGRQQQAPELVSGADVAKIIQLCEAVGGNQAQLICDAYKVDAIPDLTAVQAEAVINRLTEKLAERAKEETNAKAAANG